MIKEPLSEYFCVECGYSRSLNKMCKHIKSSKFISIEKHKSAVEWLKDEIDRLGNISNDDYNNVIDCIDSAFPDIKKEKELPRRNNKHCVFGKKVGLQKKQN